MSPTTWQAGTKE